MRCAGKGSIRCPKCDGRGTFEEGQLELLVEPDHRAPGCPQCAGTGALACPICDGTGAVEDED
jgi:DnaJ-class molecular chaperone